MPKNTGSVEDLDAGKQKQEGWDDPHGETPEGEARESYNDVPVRFIPASQQHRPAGTSPGLEPGGGGQQGPGNSKLRHGG